MTKSFTTQQTLPPLSLYVHLPWCERKCPYCDFNSHEVKEIPEQAYVDALLLDLEQDAHLALGREISTIFIGGGTPSLFSAKAITQLLAGIRQIVPLASDAEVTMEANPGSAEAEKFYGFHQAGVNRISLGVQSLNDKQLQALGRVHNSDEAHAAIEMIKATGFEQFNLDLMHGLPKQTETDAINDLKAALAYRPPHLSWYQLTVEPNTVYYSKPPVLPVEDVLADIQTSGEDLLHSAGLNQYEVSAYSVNGSQCRHNLNYWQFGDYLAVGAGAHGKITNWQTDEIRRYWKNRQPQSYMTADNKTSGSHSLPEAERIEDFMLNALRLTQGFEEALFSARTGCDLSLLQGKLESVQSKGLLQIEQGRIKATALGRRFLDTLVTEFLQN